jgi:hypothetical protein
MLPRPCIDNLAAIDLFVGLQDLTGSPILRHENHDKDSTTSQMLEKMAVQGSQSLPCSGCCKVFLDVLPAKVCSYVSRDR